ncbi:MAG: RND transporter, partial [Verrucomicrobiota bacterium]
MKRLIRSIILVLAIAGVALLAWRIFRKKDAALPPLQTAEVKRADVFSSISATGTLEPEEVVDIGAQVTGQILVFGNDIAGKTVD